MQSTLRELVFLDSLEVFINIIIIMDYVCSSDLLHCGNLVPCSLQGAPQGRVCGPRPALQNLLLDGVQMFHHVSGQALLGADKHLDHLCTQTHTK